MLRFFIDKCEFDIDVIFDFLYCDVYWLQGILCDVVECVIDGLLCFGVYVGDWFVGFVWFVIDQVMFVYLCDVFVLLVECGNGYGCVLIDYIFVQEMVWWLCCIMFVMIDVYVLYWLVGFGLLVNFEWLMEICCFDIYMIC